MLSLRTMLSTLLFLVGLHEAEAKWRWYAYCIIGDCDDCVAKRNYRALNALDSEVGLYDEEDETDDDADLREAQEDEDESFEEPEHRILGKKAKKSNEVSKQKRNWFENDRKPAKRAYGLMKKWTLRRAKRNCNKGKTM